MDAYDRAMTWSGTLACVGGGAFVANDDLDRSLLGEVGASRVVVLPTADAFEQPGTLIAAAMSWAERLDVDIEALMVMARADAEDPGAAAVVAGARAVYLAGESSMHLRSVLKSTAVLGAIAGVLADGGLVAAIGPCATAMCDPMLDQRGGAFTLGLGLASGLAVVTGIENWSAGAPAPGATARQHPVRRAAHRVGGHQPRRHLVVGRGRRHPRRVAERDGAAQDPGDWVIVTVSSVIGRLGVPPGVPSAVIAWATSSPSVIRPNTT